MNENQDLLDLCRLNLMEENVEKVESIDKEETLKAIAWKKKRLSEKLSNQGLSFSKEQIKKHRKQFTTSDDRYPPELEDLFDVEYTEE